MERPVDPTLERRSRNRWTAFILAFFAAQVVLWSFALTFVANDESHAVVADYDRRAIDWDGHRARVQASAALGWDATVAVAAGASSDPGVVRVGLRDPQARAVLADRVVATLFHQAHAAREQVVELTAEAPGVFVGPAVIDRPGKWRVRIDASRGDESFVTTRTQVVGAGVPGP